MLDLLACGHHVLRPVLTVLFSEHMMNWTDEPYCTRGVLPGNGM